MSDILAGIFAVIILLAIIVLVSAACFGTWWIAAPYIPTPVPTRDPLDVYEAAINRCEARETLTDAECQAAALREAYPNSED